MARPIRLAAPVTKAVLVNAAEVDDVHDGHENEEQTEDGNGEHGKTPQTECFFDNRLARRRQEASLCRSRLITDG